MIVRKRTISPRFYPEMTVGEFAVIFLRAEDHMLHLEIGLLEIGVFYVWVMRLDMNCAVCNSIYIGSVISTLKYLIHITKTSLLRILP